MRFLIQSLKKVHLSEMSLSNKRYEEIKIEIAELYEECELNTLPIDCFKIAEKLHYILIPYSKLPKEKRAKAMSLDKDGYSKIEINPVTEMEVYVIYFNDCKENIGRMRWTIFHEIGHCYLGHHDNPDYSKTKTEEFEADFFAKYTIAPPPLIHKMKCKNPHDIMTIFHTSIDAGRNIYNYYIKWNEYGPRNPASYEKQIISQFK